MGAMTGCCFNFFLCIIRAGLVLAAQLVGRRTKEREVWGSIPQVVMSRNLGQVSKSYIASGHPAVMGTWCTNPKLNNHVRMRPYDCIVPGKVMSRLNMHMHGYQTIKWYLYLYLSTRNNTPYKSLIPSSLPPSHTPLSLFPAPLSSSLPPHHRPPSLLIPAHTPLPLSHHLNP